MSKVQLEILGLSASQASNGTYALILKESKGTRRLPIVIGANEAQAIAIELEGIEAQRPMTHDLLKNILVKLNASLKEVCIVDMRDSTFYASLTIDGIDEEVDARPSDAIALAVRFDAPIYIMESILAEAGFYPQNEDSEEGEADGEGEETESELMRLLQMQKADENATQLELPLNEDDIGSLSRAQQLPILLARAIKAEDYEEAARLRDEMKNLGAEPARDS
ncbi:MAG: bifunctional nuclease domain-containing protein [Candidatus Kapaibacterium sp.]